MEPVALTCENGSRIYMLSRIRVRALYALPDYIATQLFRSFIIMATRLFSLWTMKSMSGPYFVLANHNAGKAVGIAISVGKLTAVEPDSSRTIVVLFSLPFSPRRHHVFPICPTNLDDQTRLNAVLHARTHERAIATNYESNWCNASGSSLWKLH